ncbi:hypothetical protein D3C71_1641450 [compost metagenome]
MPTNLGFANPVQFVKLIPSTPTRGRYVRKISPRKAGINRIYATRASLELMRERRFGDLLIVSIFLSPPDDQNMAAACVSIAAAILPDLSYYLYSQLSKHRGFS